MKLQHGGTFFKTLFLIPALLIGGALAYFGFCEARKAYWDHEVRGMCEKDGGATVYQTVVLSPDQWKKMLNEFGDLSIPTKDQIKSDSTLFSETNTTYLKQRSPQVRRSEFRLVRIDDMRLLATQTIYSRVGGDFPSFAHPSSFSCLDATPRKKSFDVEKLTVQLQGK